MAVGPELSVGIMFSTLPDAASIAILVLLGICAVLYLAIAWRPRGKRTQFRLAYLGYAACALAVTLFQLQVYNSGGIAFMMVGVFLVPLAVAGALAIGNTVGTRSATLRVLGGATLVAALFLLFTGEWGISVSFTMAIAHAYEILVVVACIWRRRDWLPQRNQPGVRL